MRKPFVIIFLLALSLASCQRNVLPGRSADIPEEGWGSDDTLRFPFDTVREEMQAAVCLTLRLSAVNPYPYEDVTLLVGREGQERPDTVVVPIATQRGEHRPTGGVALRTVTQRIDTISLRAGEAPTFTILQFMRLDPLPGIVDVGVALERIQ